MDPRPPAAHTQRLAARGGEGIANERREGGL